MVLRSAWRDSAGFCFCFYFYFYFCLWFLFLSLIRGKAIFEGKRQGSELESGIALAFLAMCRFNVVMNDTWFGYAVEAAPIDGVIHLL